MGILAVLKEIAGQSTEPDKEHQSQMPTSLDTGITLNDVVNTFFTKEERHGWHVLEVERPEQYSAGPIVIGSGRKIIDVAKFAEVTIKDLVSYIAAKNRGAAHHWAERILDEKLEHLKLCGVKAEIRRLH